MASLQSESPTIPAHLDNNRFISPGLTADATPRQASLPSLDDINKLPDDKLLEVLHHYGATQPWDAMQTRAAGYIQRLTELRPGTPEYKAELERITTTQSKRGMLGMARRAEERWNSLDAIQGNVQQTMIWVTEGDVESCDACPSRGGQIATFAEWQTIGSPGAAVCQGGDYCRCQLIVID